MPDKTLEGWLTDSYDYEGARRGQLRDGVILHVGTRGVTIDVGLKQEGFVDRRDVERLGKTTASQLKPGQEVTTFVVNPEDRNGNLVLSLFKARREQDWIKAEEMLASGEVWHAKVSGYNKGGITVSFGHIRGFVPGSHLWKRDKRRVSSDQREEAFQEYIGQELPLKVIEVDRGRRRLILSERLARRRLRDRERDRLLGELLEGDVVRGTVTSLPDFGAFVDLGGADGLIHVSELAWHRVRHPKEVLQVGDEVKVYVLRLDHERKRIGLSLKRLQPDPWSLVEINYREGQLVSGVVTNAAAFCAFFGLEEGIEGLIHISELADPPPEHARNVVQRGDKLVARVLRIEPNRRRIALSLKSVSPEEREEWLRAAGMEEDGLVPSDDGAEPADVAAHGNGGFGDEEREMLTIDGMHEMA